MADNSVNYTQKEKVRDILVTIGSLIFVWSVLGTYLYYELRRLGILNW